MRKLTLLVFLIFCFSFFFSLDFSAEADDSVVSADYHYRFRGDLGNTGVSLSPDVPETDRIVWSFETGEDIYSSAAIAEDKVFVGSWDKYLYCLDGLTGRELWRFDTKDRIYSSPTYWNGLVYIGTGTEGGSKIARLYAVNASTGTEVWSFKASKNFVGGAAVVDGKIYAGSLDGTLYALDAEGSGDGTTSVIWRYTTSGEIWSTPAIYNNSIYISSGDCRVYRVNLADGKELWRFQTEYSLDGMWSSPTVADGRLFIGSAYKPLGMFYALDADSGKQLWNFSTGKSRYGIGASPGYYNGVVYIGSNNGKVYAFNATDGTELWNFTTWDNYNGIYSSPAIADGKIYIGSSDNKLYCLNITTGAEVWSFRSGGFGEYGCCASPVVVSGRLYVGFTGDDIFYCFGDTVIPTMDIEINIYPHEDESERNFVYGGEVVNLHVITTDDRAVVRGAQLTLSSSDGILNHEIGVTSVDGLFATHFTGPIVSSTSEVQLTITAEAVGYLTEEQVFFIEVRLNPPLSYELDGDVDNIVSGTSVNRCITVKEGDDPQFNVTVELRVSGGKVSPLNGLTDENGNLCFVLTAPELENNMSEDHSLYLRIIKPGYETGRNTEEFTVNPVPPPKDGKDEGGLDAVLVGLIAAIIILIVIILAIIFIKGKKYW